MDVVNEVLRKAEEEAVNFKPVTVEKHLEVELDLGNLLAFDKNELDRDRFRSDTNQYLKEVARDNVQILLNSVWKLPMEKVDTTVVAKLPPSKYVLPRYQPPPKKKEPTKWEKFAKEKGITKTKKSKVTWDETLQKWVPRFGYKRVAAEKEKEWAVPVPGNAPEMEDQYAKKSAAKKERIAKNEFQRLRNIAASKKISIPRTGIIKTGTSKELHKATTVAKLSTASLGKFQESLPKEKPAKNIKPFLPVPGQKRKATPVTMAQEKSNNVKIVEEILNKRPKVNYEAAVNRELYAQDEERAQEKRQAKPKAGRGGKKKRVTGGKKGRGAGRVLKAATGAGKGKAPRKLSGGRKRR